MTTDEPRIRIRIVELGRAVRVAFEPPGATLSDVLSRNGIDPAGRDVRVAGRPATGSDVLSDGDLVTVIPRIRGG